MVDRRPWSELHGDSDAAYFDHHGIDLTVFAIAIDETDKTLRTAERIVDAFGDFGLVRNEPVLVVGGGLTTDVAGFACSIFRRSTNYIRIPTTLIGLDRRQRRDQGRGQPRQGQEPARRLPRLPAGAARLLVPRDPAVEQVRNGMAELIKIAVVGNESIFELLEKYGEDLLATRFGHLDGTPELREIAHRLTYDAIETMLRARDAEPPRARPRPGDRLRPHLEPDAGAAPDVPFFHGHAISIDMALLDHDRRARGYITRQRPRPDLLADEPPRAGPGQPAAHPGAARHGAPTSILQTRDGMLRAAVPAPDRHVRIPQRPDRRRARRDARRAPRAGAPTTRARGDGVDTFPSMTRAAGLGVRCRRPGR